jgi:small-conductance mechanosensitive channel
VPRALVVGYNALGIALLVTVVTIAARSAPGPLAAWPELPRNTLVFFEPFTALPLVLVMSALMGHVLLGQWLVARDTR